MRPGSGGTVTMSECMYCTQNKALTDLMFYVCDVDGHSVYFFKNQSYPGRCIVACGKHVRTAAELSQAEFEAYIGAVHKVGKAITALYHPYQINYATFGDKVEHVHCHIVPKYEGGMDFGGMFQMTPVPGVYLTDAEYQSRIAALKAALQ